MATLNGVEDLHAAITRLLPQAHIAVDAPPQPEGSWFIDVHYAGKSGTIEWRPGQGYGVAGTDAVYGEGPERVFSDAAAAARYLVSVLADTA